MQGLKVDVEATDARMKRTRRNGSPIVLSPEEAATSGNRAGNKSDVTGNKGNDQIVTLSWPEVIQRLRALDWSQRFEWTSDAQAKRARDAAQSLGYDALQSGLRDDGHWGGFQVRDTEWVRAYGFSENAIVAGYGFELTADEVLSWLREDLEFYEGSDDPSELLTVNLALLPLLARPLYEFDRAAANRLEIGGGQKA
jgi:hypothetical protein